MNTARFSVYLSTVILGLLAFSPTPLSAQDIASDPILRSAVSRQNWEPGGKYFGFDSGLRGSLDPASRTGQVSIRQIYSTNVGNLVVQGAVINGTYGYTLRFSNHPWTSHSPFDSNTSASDNYQSDPRTDGAQTSYSLSWTGLQHHPANGYDGVQGGGYPPPAGARDEYSFAIAGAARGVYSRPLSDTQSTNRPPSTDTHIGSFTTHNEINYSYTTGLAIRDDKKPKDSNTKDSNILEQIGHWSSDILANKAQTSFELEINYRNLANQAKTAGDQATYDAYIRKAIIENANGYLLATTAVYQEYYHNALYLLLATPAGWEIKTAQGIAATESNLIKNSGTLSSEFNSVTSRATESLSSDFNLVASRATGKLQIDPLGKFSESEINAARYMAESGKNVILRRPTGTRADGGTSDLLVDGVPYDVYTPTTSSANRIISNMAKKNSQANGIVLDLSKSSVPREQLGNVLNRVRGSGATKITDIKIIGK